MEITSLHFKRDSI